MSVIITGQEYDNIGDNIVRISGAKNSVLPILISTLLIRGQTVIKNAPVNIRDILATIQIVQSMGVTAGINGTSVEISNSGIISSKIPASIVKKTRYSILLLPILLKLFGRVNLCYPGGCDIGKRPIDIHIEGLRAFGVKCLAKPDIIECCIINYGRDKFVLRYPSVTATQVLILFSVLGKKNRLLINCAKEPEIEDFANFLNACGAKISGAGTERIEIQGVNRLSGIKWRLIPDRIEIGTYSLLSIIMNRDLLISPVLPDHLNALFFTLSKMSIPYKYDYYRKYLLVEGSRSYNGFKPVIISTSPYPGFPTDLQPLLVATCLKASGISFVQDNVFPKRFNYLDEIRKLGGRFCLEGNTVEIRGKESRMAGNDIFCHDIRSGAACVFGALLSKGSSIVRNEWQILRGYNNFFDSLFSLGVRIKEGANYKASNLVTVSTLKKENSFTYYTPDTLCIPTDQREVHLVSRPTTQSKKLKQSQLHYV